MEVPRKIKSKAGYSSVARVLAYHTRGPRFHLQHLTKWTWGCMSIIPARCSFQQEQQKSKVISCEFQETFPKKTQTSLKTDPPKDPVLPHLGIYPEGSKSTNHRDSCTPFLLQPCLQPRCPLTEEGERKWGLCTYTMKFFSATKNWLWHLQEEWRQIEIIKLTNSLQKSGT